MSAIKGTPASIPLADLRRVSGCEPPDPLLLSLPQTRAPLTQLVSATAVAVEQQAVQACAEDP